MRKDIFGCLRLREGKLTYCWAKGLREMKPMNFGSLKAEGNETNTVLGYWGGGSLEEGHFWVFKVEGRETCILLGQGPTEMKPINFGSVKAEGNKTNTITVLGYRGGGVGTF